MQRCSLASASLSRDYGLNSGFDRGAPDSRHGCYGAGRSWLPEMMRPTRWGGRFCVAAMAAMLGFWTVPQAQAQSSTPAPHVGSRGENFSNKPAPALFASDCTGGGCHKGPQGLGKGQSQSGLAGFLREHYTNSRESAGSLAAYILKLPAPAGAPAAEPRAARTGTPPARSGPSWFDPEPSGPPEARPPGEVRGRERQQQQQEGGRPARSAARPADAKPDAKPADAKPDEPASSEPSATPAEPAAPSTPADRRRRTAEPEPAKPTPTPRNQRGRQQPATAAAPAPAEPTPPPAPAAPPPPVFDIFD
jgi:hypothetical protein